MIKVLGEQPVQMKVDNKHLNVAIYFRLSVTPLKFKLQFVNVRYIPARTPNNGQSNDLFVF